MFKIKYLLFILLTSTSISGLAQKTKDYGEALKTKISLDDIWLKYAYYPESVEGYNSMNDGITYSLSNQGNSDIYSYKTGKLTKTLVDAVSFIPKDQKKAIEFDEYSFSSDEKRILLASNSKPIYRNSFSADYWVYNLESKALQTLSNKGAQRLATFSPNGDKVAFVRDNNLFYRDLISNEEIQITFDGQLNKIINGAPDWVYEEEFSFTKAFEWSPDGNKIAFIRFDESEVKEFDLTKYGELYPKTIKYKYPKAGEANSKVSVLIYDLGSRNSKKVDIGRNEDIYIPRIAWTTSNNVLSVQRLNRLQNKWEILLVNGETGNSQVAYNEENKYYIDITDNLIWLKNGEGFIITSEQSGFNHIYLYDMKGQQVKQLTKGNFDVIEVKGLDSKSGNLYYIPAQTAPMNRDIMMVNIKSGKTTKISNKEGTNSPQFSKGFKYFVNTFTDLNTPPFISVNDENGKEIYVLKDNAKLIKKMNINGYSPANFFKFNTKDNISLNAWMIKPLDFDSTKRYPVLIYVYGGPGSQTVLNDWGWFNLIWFEMLAQNGYIIVSVDGRGTGARGEEFKKSTYLNLGRQETIDQIEATKYLSSLGYVDSKRIGIFGWSYGGYMSALCMTNGANYFKAGIAVAPVTNWRYYDNIYTERFMRTPQENGDNYDVNSPITHVDKFTGKFLLVHGVEDDNVHVQNSMDLVTALVNKNKQFEMQFYPNNDHGIHNGRYTRYHLYKRMTDFIYLNL